MLTTIKKSLKNSKIARFFYSHPKVSKFFVLYVFFIFLYFIFNDVLLKYLMYSEYFGIFLSGVLYTFGSTGGLAVLVILEQSKHYDPIQVAMIAAMGSGIVDLFTYKYVEKNFTEELKKISNLKFFVYISNIIVSFNFKNKSFSFPLFANKYVFGFLGIILISAPTSDEFGLYFLSKVRHYKNIQLFAISSIVNFIGIYILAIL